MKKIVIKFFAFFKKEHLSKYLVEISVFFVILGLFFYMARQDVISNVAGTVIGFLFSTMLIYIFRIASTYFEDILKVNKDTEGLLKL